MSTDQPTDGRPAVRDDDALDPAESLRLIRTQQERTRGLVPDPRVVYGVWGVAWVVGYLAMWGTARAGDGTPAPWAGILLAVLVVAGVATTVVHSVVRSAGIAGPSARTGALYGWAWFLAFLAMSVVLGGLADAGASQTVMTLAGNALACLVVGTLYLGSALLWGDRHLYVLGAWILLVGATATFAGIPGSYLLLAVAGGGGFLVMAGAEQVRRTRVRRADGGHAGA